MVCASVLSGLLLLSLLSSGFGGAEGRVSLNPNTLLRMIQHFKAYKPEGRSEDKFAVAVNKAENPFSNSDTDLLSADGSKQDEAYVDDLVIVASPRLDQSAVVSSDSENMLVQQNSLKELLSMGDEDLDEDGKRRRKKKRSKKKKNKKKKNKKKKNKKGKKKKKKKKNKKDKSHHFLPDHHHDNDDSNHNNDDDNNHDNNDDNNHHDGNDNNHHHNDNNNPNNNDDDNHHHHGDYGNNQHGESVWVLDRNSLAKIFQFFESK